MARLVEDEKSYFLARTLGRQDHETIWFLNSPDPYSWQGGAKIVEPRWPWDHVQMGNCGSRIEIEQGWLVITHGVGAVRNYCIGVEPPVDRRLLGAAGIGLDLRSRAEDIGNEGA